MQSYMIILVIGYVNSYPEAGYNYNRPGGSNIIIGHHQQQNGIINGIGNGIGHSNSGLINGNNNFGNIGNSGHSGSSGFINSNAHSGSIGFINNGIGNSGSNGFINNINSGNIGNSNGNGLFTGGSTIGSTLVQKHIYVHVPPPDTEDLQIQRQIQLAPVQKHYKIIFIKAPSIPSYNQQQISLAGQNQEKTIVYVLVKKPDEIGDLTLPQIVSTPPSKPEVYFIKYKAKKEFNVAGSSGSNGNLITTTTTGHGVSGSGGIIGTGSISGNSGHSINGGTDSFTSSGIASSSIGGQGPAPQYGPPGKSGPY